MITGDSAEVVNSKGKIRQFSVTVILDIVNKVVEEGH